MNPVLTTRGMVNAGLSGPAFAVSFYRSQAAMLARRR
jgi:hypothetical protein